jgi:hypothetical protein
MTTQFRTRLADNSSSNQPSIAIKSRSSDESQLMKIMKSYQAAQQVQYLHLQAEIDVLLQQLKTLKHQKANPAVAQAENN